ncbi:helix-turn-helix domain-containing protein [Gordonia jinhuaensis]|uniref:helix-turn-helix domain-containing protein n=1 Tax=Gordonia jinhuaensis TaxID=1517702 RepID=UPI001665DA3E|nr:XRE family transcriptional regulator [Gordonia jinhuaensis]
MSSTVDLDAIGAKIRAARERNGLTLDQLSGISSISKAHLSRLEAGERQASIATLVELADALGVRVSALLGEDDEPSELAIFPLDTPRHVARGLEIAVCSGFKGSSSIEALRVQISPHREATTAVTHRGEEWLYVLSGSLEFEYDGEAYTVAAGASVHFDAGRPHRIGASVATEVLLVSAKDRTSLSQIRH